MNSTRNLISMLLSVVWLSACSSQPAAIFDTNGSLHPCPKTPNCVTSLTDPADQHYIRPIEIHSMADWDKLLGRLEAMDNIVIVTRRVNYIHAEATSRVLRFVDDLEFKLDESKPLIQLRSASRIGYSDFGVNRDRIEMLRRQLVDQQTESAN